MILAGFNIAAILLSIPELFSPIGGDTAIYAYYGRQIGKGSKLYEELWDFKSPGIYYLFAVVLKIFPDNLLTLRIMGILWGVAASAMMWLLARHLFVPRIALVLTGLFILWINPIGNLNADGPYPETFIPLLTLMAYFAWFKYVENHQGHWLIVTGVACGGLILLKQTALATLVGFVLTLSMQAQVSIHPWKDTARMVGLMVVGLGLVLLPCLAHFAALGVLDEMWGAVVEYPIQYAATTPLKEAIRNAVNLFISMFAFLSLLYALVPLGFWLIWRNFRNIRWQVVSMPLFSLIVWAFVELLVISTPGRFYERYLLQALPALLLISGYSIEAIIAAYQDLPTPNRALLSTALVMVIVISIVSQFPRTLKLLDDHVLANTPTRSELLARYFDEHSTPEDTVFAWGDHRIPYVTNRESAVRWLNAEPFRTSQHFVTPELVQQVLSELQKNQPRYFVESAALTPLGESYLGNTEVEVYIRNHYRLIAEIGDAKLYEITDNATDK